jgi:hypothetical protein
LNRLSKITPYFKFIVIIAIVVVSPLFLFQNCSQFGSPQDLQSLGLNSIFAAAPPDPNHLPQESLKPPTKQIRIVNRHYLAALFRDIFTAADGTKAPALESLLFNWVERRGAQWGGACDTNGSQTLFDCNDDASTASLPVHNDPNAIRESFKIQMCEELLGTTIGLKIVLEKAGLDINALPEPNFENLKPAYEVFYRTDEAPAYFLQTLSQLNTDLKLKNETSQNIWRGIMLVICESPEWQLL